MGAFTKTDIVAPTALTRGSWTIFPIPYPHVSMEGCQAKIELHQLVLLLVLLLLLLLLSILEALFAASNSVRGRTSAPKAEAKQAQTSRCTAWSCQSVLRATQNYRGVPQNMCTPMKSHQKKDAQKPRRQKQARNQPRFFVILLFCESGQEYQKKHEESEKYTHPVQNSHPR